MRLHAQDARQVRPAASFESDDATLEGIFALPDYAATLDDALSRAVELACALGDWSVGRFRRLDRDDDETGWRWCLPADSDAFEALRAHRSVLRSEVASSDAGTPLAVTTLGRPTDDHCAKTAHEAGLRILARLQIHAEGRPSAAIELFGTGRIDGGHLRLLVARLDQVAARDRSRAAVSRAAAYVRARTSTTAAKAAPPGTAPRGAGAAGAPSDALYDPRTGLARGVLLADRLAQAIRRRRRGDGGMLAVLLIDPGLEDPSTAGVTTIARRLAARCREADSLAHADGRDFAIVAEDLSGMPEAHALARRIANELRSPLGYDAGTRQLPCRIGVVIGGPSYDAPADLLRDARCALERVPPEGGVELFDAAARVDHENRALLESEMRRAIGSREFFVEYQPVVALSDGRITGLEAFVRWQHPQIGRIPPGEFIVAAEATPLIHQLGDWIVDTVCDQIRRWENLLPAGSVPPVDINVSQAQLLDVGFADRLLATLRRHELPGNRIRLDVNENDLMDEPERCAGVLARLKERGVRSVIDDFGTGFSSVGLLHTLPVSGLKIDGSFVREAAGEGEGSSVARTIIELARVLGLDVIAEGVETREQFRYLRNAGCRQAQGRHFAGPVGAAAACDLIRDGYPLDLEAPLK